MDSVNFTKNKQDEKHFEAETIDLIKKIQQQLIFLEKKIDTLINQSSGRSPDVKRFSKPLRPFGHYSYHGKSRNFDKQQGDENRGFGQKSKPFFRHRKERV